MWITLRQALTTLVAVVCIALLVVLGLWPELVGSKLTRIVAAIVVIQLLVMAQQLWLMEDHRRLVMSKPELRLQASVNNGQTPPPPAQSRARICNTEKRRSSRCCDRR